MSTISESVKKRWEDPEYRAKQAAGRIASNAKRSEIMKRQWQDPEVRAQRIAVMANPEVRAKMSTSHSRVMKENWQDPEYRVRQSERNSEIARTREVAPGFKDGRCQTSEYRAYNSALQRCRNRNNPYFHKYGGRGIEFRFASYEEFMATVGPRPSDLYSLDRINVNGHYEPGNVRWALATVQVKNRRKYSCLEGFSDADLLTEIRRRGLSLQEPEPATFVMAPIAA
jgi:hypothetical protein